MANIVLGYAPTRRSIFSAPDAVKYRGLTADRLRELGVSFVDIDDINEEGLLYNEEDRLKALEKFRAAGVDGLLLAHCNFGTEYICARLAKDLGVPVLLWGPLDERPEPNGVRLRDTQCGLFATGKVLRRFGVPFTYLTNCRLNDPVFERGLRDFLAVCNVVKTFRNIKILQIGPRPFDFWSTMCNEGELLEKFNIQLAPIPLPELTAEVKRAIADGDEVAQTVAYCREKMDINVTEEQLTNIAGLAVAMERLMGKYHCNAGAIQCWNALQSELGIMPCAANALLNDKGIPVVCETDIHGAVTALLVEAAANDDTRSFFADWTIRHPDKSYVIDAGHYANGVDAAEEAVPGTRQDILSGKICPVDAAVQAVAQAPPEEREALANHLRDPEVQRRGKSRSEVKRTQTERQPEETDPSELFDDEEEPAPVTKVTRKQIMEIYNSMLNSDGITTEDDVVLDMQDAVDTLIFRWNKCLELNPEIAKAATFSARIKQIAKEGIHYLQKF
ncbi:MAG: L-fucose/L-arabinose isomerase family protein [Clostridiales bacterium]|nr:L-fucose/L-arabinose isomerase family protein [Clostridiales bacterium]